MSGVVDENGQQWEYCHGCGNFIRFPQNLGYIKTGNRMKPDLYHICISCTQFVLEGRYVPFSRILPAPTWKRKTVRVKQIDLDTHR